MFNIIFLVRRLHSLRNSTKYSSHSLTKPLLLSCVTMFIVECWCTHFVCCFSDILFVILFVVLFVVFLLIFSTLSLALCSVLWPHWRMVHKLLLLARAFYLNSSDPLLASALSPHHWQYCTKYCNKYITDIIVSSIVSST